MQSSPPGYEIQQPLGKGVFGRVFKAKHQSSQRSVAVKICDMNPDAGIDLTVLREINTFRAIQHPNVVGYFDHGIHDNYVYLVLELMSGDLGSYLSKIKKSMSPTLIKSFVYQLLCGIEACHNEEIVHRDLKPQNVLIDRKGHLKIGDFGLSRSLRFGYSQNYTPNVVTLWYRAPEVLATNGKYGLPVDIWAVGCILAEMASPERLPLFPGERPIDQLARIFEIRGTPTEASWPEFSSLNENKTGILRGATFPPCEAKNLASHASLLDERGLDLLEAMLQCNPASRITAKDALEHSYFDDIAELLAPTRRE